MLGPVGRIRQIARCMPVRLSRRVGRVGQLQLRWLGWVGAGASSRCTYVHQLQHTTSMMEPVADRAMSYRGPNPIRVRHKGRDRGSPFDQLYLRSTDPRSGQRSQGMRRWSSGRAYRLAMIDGWAQGARVF